MTIPQHLQETFISWLVELGHFWSGKILPIAADLEGRFFSGNRCRLGALIAVYTTVFGCRSVENNSNRNRPFFGVPDPLLLSRPLGGWAGPPTQYGWAGGPLGKY